MSAAGLAAFGAALGVACATPGPATTALVSRTVGRGPRDAAAFGIGLLAGDLVWLQCALFGVAALLQRAAGLFLALRVLGALYLLWLAFNLWRSDGGQGHAPSRGGSPGLAGLLLALGNPKTMLFYMALTPTLLARGPVTPLDALVATAVTVAVYGSVLAAYGLLAHRAAARLADPLAARLTRRVSAAILAATAVLVLSAA